MNMSRRNAVDGGVTVNTTVAWIGDAVTSHAKHGNIVKGGHLTAMTPEIGESLLSLSESCSSM